MSEPKLPVIGITIGDFNGIGPEVIMKTLRDSRILQFCVPVIYGSSKVFNYQRKQLNIRGFKVQIIDHIDQVQTKAVNLINSLDDTVLVNFGEATKESGRSAYASIKAATEDAVQGKLDAIVTAPIQKKNIQNSEFEFPGHTEFFTSAFGADEALMFLVSDLMKTGVATGHIPVKEVSNTITLELILRKLRLMNQSLKQDFGVRKPKIAVLGLNPHAGEEGLLGMEEQEVITPAIETAKEENILALGPFPADGFFATRAYSGFDSVLAMYHDQGLIPFKALAFEKGVNFTAGLPTVRTSPDHGTAFSIAGKGVADESSFREALYCAIDVLKNRQEWQELNENPLPIRTDKQRES